ncbi:NitT/TauT family transport system ATP-binding protein [Roseomonas rosea]|uniref:NitT/TauT family transport system ATP-binding protein n=1 Tax=Muricoccus roseus TaxID=198092 RepID=A0A1M6DMA0_9PROT|nr:ABC transporter ATP-binding protein [Roseomonas rosea]SHI74300.1 NitT/TauT family transport system ATP-binding protein [Roseomonas rosea]
MADPSPTETNGTPGLAGAAAPRAPAAVRLRGVSKRYANGTLAVEGLDLDIAAGSFVSLLGPSGCGKSTLLRMVAGLAPLSTGRIEWPGATPRLGFVFQEPTLMPWQTALDNVALPLKLAGMAQAERQRRAREMLALVGLSEAASSYPRELSGGMRMRVSIARALVTQPDLLLLDEPFAALDEITRFRLNNDLLRLWEAHRFTAVFVTHSVFESVYLSERVVVMAGGPGRLHADLPIPAPPRRDEAFRTSPSYAGLCRAVSEALAGAMAA